MEVKLVGCESLPDILNQTSSGFYLVSPRHYTISPSNYEVVDYGFTLKVENSHREILLVTAHADLINKGGYLSPPLFVLSGGQSISVKFNISHNSSHPLIIDPQMGLVEFIALPASSIQLSYLRQDKKTVATRRATNSVADIKFKLNN